MEFIDEYDNICILRNNGLLPQINMTDEGGAYDYTFGLTDNQKQQLQMFDNKFYSHKLLSDEQFEIIKDELQQINDIYNKIVELDTNVSFSDIYFISSTFEKSRELIEKKLFENKKNLFLQNLKNYFDILIDIEFEKSLIIMPCKTTNCIKPLYYPNYPNIVVNKKNALDTYKKFNEISDKVNSAFWKTYSHELKFIDNLIAVSNEKFKTVVHLETSFPEISDNFNKEINKILETCSGEQYEFIKSYLHIS